MDVRSQVLPFAAAAPRALALAARAGLPAVVAALALLPRRREQPQASADRADRELESVRSLSESLVQAGDAESVGRLLLEEVVRLLGVDFAAVAVIDDEGREASGLVAHSGGEDTAWWPEMRIDLEHEPSAIASAAFEAAPLVIYDVVGSPMVSRRLADKVGAKSAAFVPIVAGERVAGVLVAATTKERRAFGKEEIALAQALAGEAALALERTRSASALAEALERERLVSEIARRVHSELDLEAVLRVAVEETGRAADVSRCFIRLGEPGEPMPALAEWNAPGYESLEADAPLFVVADLAAREQTTIALADITAAPELADAAPESVDALLAVDTKAALATPILVAERALGVFALHRPEAGAWAPAEISLAEAVAREVGLAINTAQLLAENKRRLHQQTALLTASQVVASELRLETVLERLVVEVTKLLQADAADCYLFDRSRNVLRCSAVYGLDRSLVGYEFSAEKGLAGLALARGRSMLSSDYGSLGDEVPHPAYRDFKGAIVAPMKWSGETRGVLGVGTRDPSRRFSRSDAEVIETFAGLASLALKNAESFEQSARQARIQRGFYGIATALAQPLSQSETLDAVAHASNEAFGGTFSAVVMSGERGLELAAAHELPPELAAFLERDLAGSAGALSTSASDGHVLASSNLPEDERFAGAWHELARSTDFRSLLAIPVAAPRHDRTGLALVFFRDELVFSDDELELAHHLAGAARGALERSELFEAERSSRALSQQLARMGGLLASVLDPAAVLHEVVTQAPALLGAQACSVRVLEGDELTLRAAHGEGTEKLLGVRSPSTARLLGDVVQTRSPAAVSDVGDDERLLEADLVLAEGYSSYLGVPLFGAEGSLYGVLAVYDREPRTWREEEIEALEALAGNASAVLGNAELYQRMAHEREQGSKILANIADGIVAVDREGEVVLWNAAAERITGVPASEALGRTTAQVLQRSLESGSDRPASERFVAVRRGTEEIWLSLTEAVMRDPAGAIAGRIFAFRDVSSERIVEEMKSEFVSTVSHELRTPLTSIYGFAETLLRDDVLFEEADRQTFLGYIASEAKRLTAIVDTLLNVARLDTGDLQFQLTRIDVRPVVSEVVGGVESAADDRHQFVLELPEEPLDAAADPDKLRQVIANLVDNAVKFSPQGGTVTVAARRAGGAIEVRVVDQGVGISAIERERIFRKFYRGDAADKEPGAGTGLGLFIAHGLITAMGGRIWVDSAEGEGSTFGFELPLASDTIQAEALAAVEE